MAMTTGGSIDDYLAGVPDDARATLEDLRGLIRETAPEAVESMSYGMPTFKYRGKPLVYIAALKKHCAIYALSPGTIRFPAGEPPAAADIVALLRERMAASDEAATARKGKKRTANPSD